MNHEGTEFREYVADRSFTLVYPDGFSESVPSVSDAVDITIGEQIALIFGLGPEIPDGTSLCANSVITLTREQAAKVTLVNVTEHEKIMAMFVWRPNT